MTVAPELAHIESLADRAPRGTTSCHMRRRFSTQKMPVGRYRPAVAVIAGFVQRRAGLVQAKGSVAHVKLVSLQTHHCGTGAVTPPYEGRGQVP